MKKMYLGGLVTACILFAITYSASIQSKQKPDRTTVSETVTAAQSATEEEPVVKVQEPFVTEQMNFTRIVADERTGEQQTYHEKMPSVFVGLHRNEVIDHLQEETKRSYAEIESETRIHYELISFSSAGLTIKETMTANPNAYECFIIAEGDFVNIYTADRTSLYWDTMLYRTDFSEEVQADLVQGIYMTTVMDLYDFLQNHTS